MVRHMGVRGAAEAATAEAQMPDQSIPDALIEQAKQLPSKLGYGFQDVKLLITPHMNKPGGLVVKCFDRYPDGGHFVLGQLYAAARFSAKQGRPLSAGPVLSEGRLYFNNADDLKLCMDQLGPQAANSAHTSPPKESENFVAAFKNRPEVEGHVAALAAEQQAMFINDPKQFEYRGK